MPKNRFYVSINIYIYSIIFGAIIYIKYKKIYSNHILLDKVLYNKQAFLVFFPLKMCVFNAPRIKVKIEELHIISISVFKFGFDASQTVTLMRHELKVMLQNAYIDLGF